MYYQTQLKGLFVNVSRVAHEKAYNALLNA